MLTNSARAKLARRSGSGRARQRCSGWRENGQQSVVMLSLEDFNALEETAYLLRSPANAKRLLSAVEALSKGKGRERKLAT